MTNVKKANGYVPAAADLAQAMTNKPEWKQDKIKPSQEEKEAYLASLSPEIRELEEEILACQNVFRDIITKDVKEGAKVWNLTFQINGRNATRIKVKGPRGGECESFKTFTYKSQNLDLWEHFDPKDPKFARL